jgi:hypothetical protein
MPGKYQIGNVADWGAQGADLSYLTGILSGGLMESAIGESYSVETWGGWNEMMREYRVIMANIAQPQLVVVSQDDNPTGYQSVRYGLASTLMDNGYYAFTNISNGYSGTFWFDEYDDAGKGTGYLGMPVSGPSLTPYQNGVYMREFDHGFALVNPKGNGTQTVTLPVAVHRILGTQAPSVNNGATIPAGSPITLQDRDGLILLK